MTGETTLRGRVTAIGGLKEKVLAAKRAGIHTILVPEQNRKDVEEIKSEYLEGITFHYVTTNEQVLELALQK
jgi:ATP-dependent Lon protease